VLERLGDVQLALRDEELTGWLLVSMGGVNPIAERLLSVDPGLCRRRWFYWIPADGIPVLLAHCAELGRFPGLPGDVIAFRSWPELRSGLERTLPPRGTVAMEHSPMGLDADLGRVDGGTIELVRSYGPHVVSSEALTRRLMARWSDEDLGGHLQSAAAISTLLDASFSWLGEAIAGGQPPTERRLVARIEELASERELALCQAPRVASGSNTADPTHVPTDATDRPVSRGDLVSITIVGAKRNGAAAELGAIAYVGDEAPKEIASAYALTRRAIEEALELIRNRADAGRRVLGFEVDRQTRDVFASGGAAESVVHRAGHGLTADGSVAPGTQLDGLEMHDTRPIEPGYVFVLHPGTYREEWGLRLTTCFHLDREGELRVSYEIPTAPRLL
jgi:Xaa-Pro aminopeptidase